MSRAPLDANSSTSLIAVQFDQQPLDSDVDMRVNLVVRPVRAVVVTPLFARIAKFFVPPDPETMAVIAVSHAPAECTVR